MQTSRGQQSLGGEAATTHRGRHRESRQWEVLTVVADGGDANTGLAVRCSACDRRLNRVSHSARRGVWGRGT